MRQIFSTQHRSYFDYLIIACIIPLSLALLYIISHFGSPMTDEGFPLAIAMRFLQGQRPFIDDLSPYIGLGLLITPILKLSILLHDGKDGLILFARHAYIVFSLLMGCYAFFSTKKYLPIIVSFFIAISIALFHPFGINNFHYDTLGLTLWTVIIFQLYNFLFTPVSKITDYMVFSLLNLALCFAYPTFISILVLVYCVCFFFVYEKQKFYFSHAVVAFVATAFMIWLIFGFYGVQFTDIVNTIHFNQILTKLSSHGHTKLGKLEFITVNLFNQFKIFLGIALCLTIAAFYSQKVKFLASSLLLTVLIVPAFCIDIFEARYTEIFYFFNCIGFSALFIFVMFLRKNALAQRLFYSIWIPSFIAGFLTCLSSYNQDLNFIIGFFPAVLLGFVFIYLALQEIASPNYFATRSVLIYGFVAFAFFQANFIYGEIKLGLDLYTSYQKYPVTGPFNGLYIDERWSTILSNLQKDLPTIDTANTQFVYFGPFSSGYLLMDKLQPGEFLAYCLYTNDHFGLKTRHPSYTIDLSRALALPEDMIKTYLPSNYTKVLTAPSYDIYYTSNNPEVSH